MGDKKKPPYGAGGDNHEDSGYDFGARVANRACMGGRPRRACDPVSEAEFFGEYLSKRLPEIADEFKKMTKK